MFNRMDICDAYYMLEVDYNVGGWLHERKSNVRRGIKRGCIGESTDIQLSRMGYKPSPLLSYETLSDNSKELYHVKCLEYGFTEQLRDIEFIEDIQALPQAILVDRDYDVLHTLVSIGMLESVDGDGTTESETWDRFWDQRYHGLFVLTANQSYHYKYTFENISPDYIAVWGYEGSVPYTYKSLDLLWLNGKLMSQLSNSLC